LRISRKILYQLVPLKVGARLTHEMRLAHDCVEACLVTCASTYTRECIYATHVLVTVSRGSALCGSRKNTHKRSHSHDACSRVCACGIAGRCNHRI